MFESALGAMRLSQSLVGVDLRRRYRASLCRVSAPHQRSTSAMLMDHIPRCPCSWYDIQLHDQIVHVLKEFMLEAGATKGRDLRLEVRRIRSIASRDRTVDVVWLDFMAPHRHLAVDVTVTITHTNTNFPRIGARLPLLDSLTLGAQHGKLDSDLCTSALLGTSSVQSVHDCYPFAIEDGGRLAPMPVALVDREPIFVAVRRFHGMGAAEFRSLHFDSYARMQHFLCRTTCVPFRRLVGGVRREFIQSLSAALHGTLFPRCFA
jgi:hypothetical protein